jgi:hypothetical protein
LLWNGIKDLKLIKKKEDTIKKEKGRDAKQVQKNKDEVNEEDDNKRKRKKPQIRETADNKLPENVLFISDDERAFGPTFCFTNLRKLARKDEEPLAKTNKKGNKKQKVQLCEAIKSKNQCKKTASMKCGKHCSIKNHCDCN